MLKINGYKEVSQEIWRCDGEGTTLHVIKQTMDSEGHLSKRVHYFIIQNDNEIK